MKNLDEVIGGIQTDMGDDRMEFEADAEKKSRIKKELLVQKAEQVSKYINCVVIARIYHVLITLLLDQDQHST